jgi:hypothetical protein
MLLLPESRPQSENGIQQIGFVGQSSRESHSVEPLGPQDAIIVQANVQWSMALPFLVPSVLPFTAFCPAFAASHIQSEKVPPKQDLLLKLWLLSFPV